MSTPATDPASEREIRVLGASDHAALVSLALTSSTGSEQFRVDRSPDYFALGHELGDTSFYGLFQRGTLVGSLAISEQLRFISEKPERVAYIHDVRVHPDHGGRGTFRTFISDLKRSHLQHVDWIFCCVLDDNPYAPTVRKLGQGYGPERILGHMVHVGLPVVTSRPAHDLTVTRVTGEEAWSYYLRFAAPLDLAPADRVRFLSGEVEHLAVTRNDQVVAVAAWRDQRQVRRFVATRERTLAEALLSRWMVRRGAAPLARRGEIAQVAYLSHFAAQAHDRALTRALVGFMAKSAPGRHSHVFLGLAPEAARAYRELGAVHFDSTIYAYGAVPGELKLTFRELSWI